MKLIIICANCHNKVALNSQAATRPALAGTCGSNFNISCPHCSFQNLVYTDQVFAEPTLNNLSIPAGAIVGGIIGLLGGPLGLLIGLTAGGATGTAIDRNKENQAVARFNHS
jgi:hypothetical protein